MQEMPRGDNAVHDGSRLHNIPFWPNLHTSHNSLKKAIGEMKPYIKLK